jgi:hypothetical protein
MNELQNVESRLVARIKELQVMVAELDELRAIAKRLGLDVDGATPAPRGRGRAGARSGRATATRRATTAKRTTATKPSVGRSTATRARRSAGRRGSARREQVLSTIAANPNIRVREVAEKIGVSDPTSLYRVVRQLETEGAITKNGPLLSAK